MKTPRFAVRYTAPEHNRDGFAWFNGRFDALAFHRMISEQEPQIGFEVFIIETGEVIS